MYFKLHMCIHTISSCTHLHPYPEAEQCYLTTKTHSRHLDTLDVSAPLGGHDVLALCLFSVQPGWCTTSVAQDHTTSDDFVGHMIDPSRVRMESEGSVRDDKTRHCSSNLRLDPQAPPTPLHPFPLTSHVLIHLTTNPDRDKRDI